MLRKFILSAVALSAATPANAAEWWWMTYTGDKPDRSVFFIDKSSFSTDYLGRVSAWELVIDEKLQSDGTRKEKSLYRFDCKNRTFALTQLIKYGNNDRLLKSYVWQSFDQSENNIVPESIGETKWKFVCKGESGADRPLTGTPEEFSAFLFRYLG